jgi:hypothetical protein
MCACDDAIDRRGRGADAAHSLSLSLSPPFSPPRRANFDSIQIFGLETQVVDGSDIDAKFDGATFIPNVAFVKYEDDGPYFHFFIDAFRVERQ